MQKLPPNAHPRAGSFIYFLHIPKTAGSSVHRFLSSVLPAEQICPGRSWDDLHSARGLNLRDYRVFSGHFMDALEPLLGVELQTVTILRDPVERAISHYAHVRRDPFQPAYDLARKLSLEEFCQHPETRHLIEDLQSVYLSCQVLTAEPGGPGITASTERAMLASYSPSEIRATARDRLRRCVAVGTTERLSETLAVFAWTLGLRWNGVLPFENASYNRPRDIDRRTIDMIREMTQLDAELYDEANERLDASLARLRANLSEIGDRRTLSTLIPQGLPVGGRSDATNLPSRARWLSPAWRSRLKMQIANRIQRGPGFLRSLAVRFYILSWIARDRRISWRQRIPAIFGIGYCISPFDLIPDNIPVLGYLDDVCIVALCLRLSVMLVDHKIIQEFRSAAEARFLNI